MSKTIDYPIVGSYNNQRVQTIDAERSVNMFEYRDPLGKKPTTLLPTSGLVNTNFVFTGQTTGFRAQYVLLGFEYLVVGNGVYRIDSSNNLSLLGSLTTTLGYVAIDANSHQILFVDGVFGYVWDTVALTFVQITDPAFPPHPIDCCMLDNFAVVIQGTTNNFQLSMYDNALIWGPDNNSIVSPSTFTMAATSSDIVITFLGGSIANYQIGTPVVFGPPAMGSLPAEITEGVVYYVKSIVNSTTITISATNGGTVITSVAGGSGTITNQGQLQEASVTTHPGTLVACRTLHRRLFLFCQNFTEIWENAGLGTNLPFRRNNSLLMEYGCAAIGSVAIGFDLLFFMSQDRDGLGAVMMVSGTESIPISTRALDYQLAQFNATTGISDCRGFLIKENGLIFYRMNFTTSNHTFVYNVTQSVPNADETKFWHEEEVLNGDRHPAQTHGFLNGINYVGNYKSPILYSVHNQIFQNAGEAIRRMRITRPLVPAGYQRIRVDRLQIDLLQGQLVDHADPGSLSIFLSISKDGGQTYGYQISTPMGTLGDRTYRSVFRKLGTTVRGQPWLIKTEFYSNYPFIILGASWAVEQLPE